MTPTATTPTHTHTHTKSLDDIVAGAAQLGLGLGLDNAAGQPVDSINLCAGHSLTDGAGRKHSFKMLGGGEVVCLVWSSKK